MMGPNETRFALSMPEAAKALKIGLSKLAELVADGEIASLKSMRETLGKSAMGLLSSTREQPALADSIDQILHDTFDYRCLIDSRELPNPVAQPLDLIHRVVIPIQFVDRHAVQSSELIFVPITRLASTSLPIPHGLIRYIYPLGDGLLGEGGMTTQAFESLPKRLQSSLFHIT